MEATANRLDGCWITHFGGKDHGRRTFMRTYPAASASAGGSRGVLVQGTVPVLASAPVRPVAASAPAKVAPVLRATSVRPAAAVVPASSPARVEAEDPAADWELLVTMQQRARPAASKAEVVRELSRRFPRQWRGYLTARATECLQRAAAMDGGSRSAKMYRLSQADPELVQDYNAAKRLGLL